MSSFDDAEYYDCGDPEQLQHESPEEAIEAEVDLQSDPGNAILAELDKLGPLVVVAYRRKEIDECTISRLADSAVEGIIESLAEEMAGPDDELQMADGAQPRLVEEIRAALERFAPSVRAWACEEVARRTYSRQEVETILREHTPSWFEP